MPSVRAIGRPPSMVSNRKIATVVNPHSAGGKTACQWSPIAQALEKRLGEIQTCLTEKKGDGISITRELLREGYDLIIAAGGDGTVNEVANGFLENDRPVRGEACLGILPLGTGGDFRRTLGINAGIEPAIETLASGSPLLMDVGKVSFTGHDGSPYSRYFVNVASFGLGGEAARRSRNAARRLGGRAAFLWAIFQTAFAYQGKEVRLTLDGSPLEFFITNVALGNGEFHGGGMRPCPRAILNDGIFEVTVIEYLNLFQLARDVRILYSKDVFAYHHPKVHHFSVRRIKAEASEPTHLEVDGEPLGKLPLEATVLPNCLRVMVPAGSSLLTRTGE
ncbi:MAG: diacylglycerol/lipid kinase family protein [Deltaproteobacteria bacterium]